MLSLEIHLRDFFAGQKKRKGALNLRSFMSHKGIFVFLAYSTLVLGCASATKKELSAADRARLLVDIANGAILEGDPTGALQNLARAEVEDPRLPELHHSRSLAFAARKEQQLAIASARKAVEIKPDYSEANNTLGKLLLDDGKWAEAETFLLKAAGDPLYREGYKPKTNLGILYYRRGELSRAELRLNEAIQLAPQLACVSRFYMGHIRSKQGRLKEAIQHYENSTRRQCSYFPDAHFAMGIAYELDRQYEQARKKYVEIQSRFPESAVASRAIQQLKGLP